MFLCKSNEPSKCNFLIKKLYARSKGIGKRCSQKWDGGCSLPDAINPTEIFVILSLVATSDIICRDSDLNSGFLTSLHLMCINLTIKLL